MRSICFVNCAVFTNKFVDPSKWFLFPFKDRFSASSLERCLKNCFCLNNWAASWQNGMCAQSDLLCALWVAKDHTVLHANSKDWSDWADAQVDLSLRWRTYHFVGFVSMWLNYYIHMYVLSVNVLGLSDISGSKCILLLKLWWFNVLWGAIKKCLINYYSLMCFSLSKVPCVSCVMLIWYFLLF